MLDTNQLLATGAMEGPFRAPHPRAQRSVRRFIRALVAFLAAPRIRL